ncbi:hypothetical protein J7K24_00880 [bacterium]|nr:hypothetical protein [bacterium]
MSKEFMVGFFLTEEEQKKIEKGLKEILGEDFEGEVDVFVEVARVNDEYGASKIAQETNKGLNRTISVIPIDLDDIFRKSEGP